MAEENDTPKPEENTPATQESAPASSPAAGTTDMGLVAYIAFAVGFITAGLGSIVSVVIAYSQRAEVAGSWQESHYTWLIRTFWIGLAGWFISFILLFILIGGLLMIGVFIWMIIRLVKGWILYDKKEPIPDPDNLLFG